MRYFLLSSLLVLLNLSLVSGARAHTRLHLNARESTQGVRTLILDNHVGEIRLQGSRTPGSLGISADIAAHCSNLGGTLFELFHWSWHESCSTLRSPLQLRALRIGDSLRLTIVNPDGLIPHHLVVDWALRVPAGIQLKIHEGVGNVSLDDTRNPLQLSVGVGSILLTRVATTRLDASDGVGRIVFIPLSTSTSSTIDANLTTGTGMIKAELGGLADKLSGKIHLSTGLGQIVLLDIPCAFTDVTASSGMGEISMHDAPPGMRLRRQLLSETVSRVNAPNHSPALRIRTGTGAISLTWSQGHCPGS